MRQDASLGEQHQTTAEDAAANTLDLNPLLGLRSADLMEGAQRALGLMLTEPALVMRHWTSLLSELTRIATGASDRAPQPGDKRFADPAWQTSGLHHRLMQAYLAWGSALSTIVNESRLGAVDKQRAQFISTIVVDALAPTNNLVTNPTAIKKSIDTGGRSLFQGFQHFLDDLGKNGGLPSQVDASAFRVGANLATTPGAVVFRNDVLELIQYQPLTDQVRRRPLVMTPPQINKFYVVDLTPDKSLIQFHLKNGFQVFAVSWRNPTAAQRDWGLETYVDALDQAVDAAREIARSEDVTLYGACAGGVTSTAYLGYLAAIKQSKVRNALLTVCMLDFSATAESQLGALATPTTMSAAKAASSLRGVLDGQDLARMFAWMRPNDLVWNYWVNNYLLGNEPPAFDILYWNADTTRLPAQLHHDFIDLYLTNPFVNASKLHVKGRPIDLKQVRVDSYVVAGLTDHITPWKAVYRSARILGEETTFVLSTSGHIQSLINPPNNPKASYRHGKAQALDAEAFEANATECRGSWWSHWLEWLRERSEEEVAAPVKLGNDEYPPLLPAPGTYVFA